MYTLQMFDIPRISYSDKESFYRELRGELAGICDSWWITNMANASALLAAHLPEVNWVGFYVFDGRELRLGPFHGLPACLKIALNRGVCGMAAATRQMVCVDDVQLFAGHIACDTRSRSEIVIPLIHQDRLLGVLDVDSPEIARFDSSDSRGLQALAEDLLRLTSWPAQLI